MRRPAMRSAARRCCTCRPAATPRARCRIRSTQDNSCRTPLVRGDSPYGTLSGPVRVFGADGGPFTVVLDNQGLANDQTTALATTNGVVTAAVSQPLPQITTTIQGNEQQRIRLHSDSGLN